MRKYDIFLDLLTFEIRYSYGHLFWDRCGQTILDIQKHCDGWFSEIDPKNSGRLENPEKGMDLSFSNRAFSLSTKKFKDIGEDLIIEEVKKTWKIVRANIGLEEYDRIGCRFFYLKPTESFDESEILIKNSEFNIKIPGKLKDTKYNAKIRQMIAIFEKEDVEYRVELKGISRSHAIDPTGLYRSRPDTLSKHQKEYRIQKMKQIREYSTNPMYAVMLDIDCARYNPEQVSIEKYLKKQIDVVSKDFLPILEKL